MARPGPDETQRLYGHRKVSKPQRRLMLAMLAAGEPHTGQLADLAQVTRHLAAWWLMRMQTLGWAEIIREPVPDDSRIRYRLTGRGAAGMQRLLGLDPDPWPRLTGGRASDASSD